MKYASYIFLLGFFVASCAPSEEIEKDDLSPDIEVIDDFSEFEDVRTNFKESSFKSPVHAELLEELDICLMVDQDSTPFAACSPENFRIIPIFGEDQVKESFILQMKAGIVLKGQDKAIKDRSIIVFERERNELVKVNGFHGEITSLKEGENGAKEMILTMYDHIDECYFDCLFKWDGNHYSFDAALAINYGEGFKPIKTELRDSISKDIYNELMSKSIIY
ncbi:MAG: hypothetical protein MK066_15020 [Crocinitomicaceae bacterium]|nr:hypothetical protein [Crocinitomicaceae bacterium]